MKVCMGRASDYHTAELLYEYSEFLSSPTHPIQHENTLSHFASSNFNELSGLSFCVRVFLRI